MVGGNVAAEAEVSTRVRALAKSPTIRGQRSASGRTTSEKSEGFGRPHVRHELPPTLTLRDGQKNLRTTRGRP